MGVVLMWICDWYLSEISPRRSAGGGSYIQSAWPFSTSVTESSSDSPIFMTIESG